MSKTFIINVTQETADYLQRLSFELNNYRDNLAYLIDTRRDDPGLVESDAFKRYQNLTMDRYAEFELAKESVSGELIPDGLKPYVSAWSIDFQFLEMQIVVEDAGTAAAAEYGFSESRKGSACLKCIIPRVTGGCNE